MHWSISVSLLCSSLLPLIRGSSAEKHYAIMDNDWCTAGFVPFLIALDGGVEVLALASSEQDKYDIFADDSNRSFICLVDPDTANTWQPQVALHALATLEDGSLSCIPVYPGATWPLFNTPDRFHAWEAIHGQLPWQGAFAPVNKTLEAEGNDPTSGNPNRIVKSAFKEGFPTGHPNNSTSAANFVVEMVHKYPGQVSIYSAGALMKTLRCLEVLWGEGGRGAWKRGYPASHAGPLPPATSNTRRINTYANTNISGFPS